MSQRRPATDPARHSVLFKLARAYNSSIVEFEKDTGLSSARWRLLLLVYRMGGGTQKELINAIRVDPGAITRQLNAIERDGLVRREPDPADNRRVMVSLTRRGQALVDRILEVRRRFLARMTDGVPAGDLAALHRALDRIAENMGAPGSASDRDSR